MVNKPSFRKGDIIVLHNNFTKENEIFIAISKRGTYMQFLSTADKSLWTFIDIDWCNWCSYTLVSYTANPTTPFAQPSIYTG